MKNNHAFLIHYVSLLLLLLSGFVLFVLNKGYPQNQFLVALLVAVLYVFWGIIHHSLKGDLHPRIVVEYSLIALLSVIIVRGALIR